MALYGVENLKKLVDAVAEIGNAIGGVLEDGKFTAADMKEVDHLWPVITDLSTIQYSMIVPEAKDIDAAEGKELVDYFCSKFDIPEDNVEAPLEYVLKFLGMCVDFVIELIKLIKSKPIPAISL